MPTLPPRQLRLMARSEREGELKTLRTDIVEVLEIRFGIVTADITEQLDQVDDVSHLRVLLRVAVRVESVDEFRAQLS